MTPRANIYSSARDFAERMQRVLNTTICDNVVINAVLRDDKIVTIGHNLSKNLVTPTPFRAGVRSHGSHCWLDIFYKLCLDQATGHLMVLDSFFGVYAREDETSCLCHFDYERNKADGYPEAHLQIDGESPALSNWDSRRRSRGLAKLHFPVGGRRFRPTLEDIIEFLIIEKLADARDGWPQKLEVEREEFRKLQLRAAIRRDPKTARSALETLND